MQDFLPLDTTRIILYSAQREYAAQDMNDSQKWLSK